MTSCSVNGRLDWCYWIACPTPCRTIGHLSAAGRPMYKGLELLLNIRSTTHAHISPVSQIHDLQRRMCCMLNIKAATRGCIAASTEYWRQCRRQYPNKILRFLRSAWIFLCQISLSCSAGYWVKVQCFRFMYLFNILRTGGNANFESHHQHRESKTLYSDPQHRCWPIF